MRMRAHNNLIGATVAISTARGANQEGRGMIPARSAGMSLLRDDAHAMSVASGGSTVSGPVNEALTTASMVLGGIIIGVRCAHAVPSSSVVELALLLGLVLLTTRLAWRLSEDPRPEPPGAYEACVPARRRSSSSSRSTTRSETVPVPDEILTSAHTSGSDDSDDNGPSSSSDSDDDADAAAFRERVERERRRLGLSGAGGRGGRDAARPPAVRATAHSLRFRDADGRDVRYALRGSRRKTRAVVLEVRIDDAPAARRVRSVVVHDRASGSGDNAVLCDGNDVIPLDATNVEDVLRGLSLLCKVAGVALRHEGEGPQLQPTRTGSCGDVKMDRVPSVRTVRSR